MKGVCASVCFKKDIRSLFNIILNTALEDSARIFMTLTSERLLFFFAHQTSSKL